MDYSAVVIPVTKASKSIDKPDHGNKPLNSVDEKNWKSSEYCLRHVEIDADDDLDDPELYDGAPVGIQTVARKFEEEKIWAVRENRP
jgi:amidase